MAEFTKGDWVVGFNPGVTGPTAAGSQPFCGGRDWPYRTITVGEETIAIVPAQAAERIVGKHSQALMGSDLANAQLIAAAPKMYEALKALVEYYERTKSAIPCLADAITALAEAEGKKS